MHRLAQAQFDKGAVDAGTVLPHIVLMVKPSARQRAELEELVANQQNPSSPLFHKWLTPDEFGSRFGLSPSDHSKVVAWLAGEGFEVTESARGRNWIAFRGTAGQVARHCTRGFTGTRSTARRASPMPKSPPCPRRSPMWWMASWD